MAFASCSSAGTSESGGDSADGKVKVLLAGQTADESGAYSVTLKEDESESFTLVVGTMTDYSFTVANSATEVVSASVTQTTLTIEALAEGTAVLTVSEESEKSEDLVVNVTVESAGAEATAPTSLIVNGTSGGVGELSDPYTISFSAGKSSEHNLVVRPAEADKEFTWTVGKIENGAFAAEDGAALTVAQEGGKLTLGSDTAGEYAVEGRARTGDLAVYLQVTVSEYTALTGISANLAESEEAEYDYYFRTAKGTTWNMTDGMTGRAQSIAGGNVVQGYQIPLNQTYYPSLYKMVFTPEPASATDSTWVMTYSESGIFTLNADGNWTADKAGSTVITVSNTSGEAEIKIKVDVVDTLYNGVLKSEFDEAEADSDCFWNFDSDPDDYEYTKGMLGDWRLVMNKTTSNPNGDDGNQKMFYLGTTERVYGICLESRIDSSTGLSAGTVTALTWTKAHIPAAATTLTAVIGNNDKVFGSYRITLVKADGTSACITNGWVEKTKANDDGKPQAEYTIPDAFKDCDAAIVIETSLGQTDNNCELHVKGIWINSYKQAESVTLAETSKTVGQQGTYIINATVLPSDASYKTLVYSVISAPAGGENGVTVSENGVVSVAADAAIGEYKIKVASTDNPEAFAEFTLTVEAYNPLTQFEGALYLSGREISYDTDALKGATIRATIDSNGIYTDAPLSLKFTYNADASRTTYTVEMSENGIVSEQDGVLSFVGAGTVVVTIKPDDNAELAFSFTVVVSSFNADSSLVPGTNITVTSAEMLGADAAGAWTDADGLKRFIYNTVDRRHGNAKWNYDGDAIQFESHVVTANSENPVNIGYNYVAVAENAKYLTFKVHGHSDDRYLESSNVRVRIAYAAGESWTVDTLLDWTTIASRWKQENEWYTIALDVGAYAGKNVIVIFEAVGGLQNNGNFPKGSDSSAGGYLYLKEIGFATELPAGAMLAADGEIAPDYNNYRMYANGALGADGWTVSAAGKAGEGYGSYADHVYAPLTLTYTGSLNEKVSLALTTATFYSNTVEAMLYPWGVFPALNNAETGNIQLSSSDETIFTVENGVLLPVANGTAKLTVKALAYNSRENYVSFEVTVKIEAVELSVNANVASATIEAGGSYALNYYTVPADAETDFAVVSKPEGATDAMYTLTGGTFKAADNAALGSYVVRISLKDAPTVYAEVTVNVTKITSWADKNAILDGNTGWKLNEGGSYDAGVGEGADLNRGGSYWYRTVNMTDLETLTVNARVFVRGGETNPVMYVSVVVDGQEVRIRANGADSDTVTLDTTDPKYDSPNAYVYDLSAYKGKTVEIRIGIDQGTHCVITSIALS